MHDQPKLTARQQEILELIQKTIAETGAPPTRAEIAQVLGFKSANAAEEHLQALARKGAIDLVSGTSRGIRLKGSSRNNTRQSTDLFSMPLPGFAQLALPLIGRVAAVRNGQIVVARLGDEVTVKRLRRQADRIELLPENPDYPIIFVNPDEPFDIEGLAVGLIRNTLLM